MAKRKGSHNSHKTKRAKTPAEQHGFSDDQHSALGSFVKAVIAGSGRRGSAHQRQAVGPYLNADQVLADILMPISSSTFFSNVWEQTPLFISRPSLRQWYSSWLSEDHIFELLSKGGSDDLKYGHNLDVTRYIGTERHDFNFNVDSAVPNDTVDPDIVRGRYEEGGASLRLLHPQRYFPHLAQRMAHLEELFNGCIGCNAYLTPPDSQGFAPHWDDIDAFILQLEGAKRWRIARAWQGADNQLARYSSPDLPSDADREGFDTILLQPGDMLYMPRGERRYVATVWLTGSIHQAQSLPDQSSLHLTISANQRNTWADFFELALPAAIDLACDEDISLRESLPLDFTSYMGVMHSEDGSLESHRAAFMERAHKALDAVLQRVPFDSVADEMSVRFLRQRLPHPDDSQQAVRQHLKVHKGSAMRLAGIGIARLVAEEDKIVLYHCLANSHKQHASGHGYCEGKDQGPPGRLEFEPDAAETLEHLLKALPHDGPGVPIKGVLRSISKDSIAVAQRLCDAGILVG